MINVVPLLPGYRWHWVAQIWRRRPLGEFANATTTRSSMALLMRQARSDRSPMPPEFVDIPSSQLRIVKGAGHWPWIDDPSVIDDVLSFVS